MEAIGTICKVMLQVTNGEGKLSTVESRFNEPLYITKFQVYWQMILLAQV